MIHYIFQIVAFQLLFLMVYDIFLKRETFFSWNRIYLLITPILSVVLPLIEIEFIKDTILQEYLIQLPEVIIGNANSQRGINIIGSGNSTDILTQLWLLGTIISFTIFCYKYYQITKLKKKGTGELIEGISVIILKDTDAAFSFFNTIFIGEKLPDYQKSTILIHEKTHVDQNHSIDLLVFEAFRIIFWFNPLVYIFQKRMVILQEYIADACVADQKNKNEYYQDLLSQVFNTQRISFINPFFNHSLIKKRIVMLKRSKSKQIGLFKYLLIIPVIGFMLTYTSCAQEAEKSTDETKVVNKKEYQKEKTNEIPFAVIDKVPTYPDCTGDNEALKACMSKKIWDFVGKEFNTKVSKDSGITGKQRIVVQFIIDETGSVTKVKAKAEHEELKEEAIRVVSSLPQMLPGEHKGKVVSVQYALPIVFELE